MERILLIDDDLLYLDELGRGLSGLGYEVETASNGTEGSVLLRNGDFDLAICDMIMAGGGALSFLHSARETYPDLPIIVITGRREIATSPLFRDGMSEANAKIEKSSPLPQIEAVIRSVLECGTD